ncbi:uncharacterized protein ARMOST_10198 [Armillaria ostoyae]|uniref:Uncharacterized protein n=1 Tax=Armillaria ostoyae TaxID=47428 RepID=A0A284RDL7_ARMOS|nr:uncharacterized protein ARMOST_10198 [Armillaria ostoyae]
MTSTYATGTSLSRTREKPPTEGELGPQNPHQSLTGTERYTSAMTDGHYRNPCPSGKLTHHNPLGRQTATPHGSDSSQSPYDPPSLSKGIYAPYFQLHSQKVAFTTSYLEGPAKDCSGEHILVTYDNWKHRILQMYEEHQKKWVFDQTIGHSQGTNPQKTFNTTATSIP